MQDLDALESEDEDLEFVQREQDRFERLEDEQQHFENVARLVADHGGDVDDLEPPPVSR